MKRDAAWYASRRKRRRSVHPKRLKRICDRVVWRAVAEWFRAATLQHVKSLVERAYDCDVESVTRTTTGEYHVRAVARGYVKEIKMEIGFAAEG